jgi:dihydroorotate dehydrogenase (fumarate)
MASLDTSFMGLSLKSPIIAGSSGITNQIDNLVALEKAGVGAVVLKSLFEEQIRNEILKASVDGHNSSVYPEAYDYIAQYTRSDSIASYLNLIREAKSKLSIPVIASINCVSANEWLDFAAKIEQAGADALELNIFMLPSDTYRTGDDNEAVYHSIINQVLKVVNIPVSIKMSSYFSSLGKTALQLSWTGIKGMVMFNRFYSPDIDIDKMEVTSGFVFSNPSDISMPLRWIAMLSGRLHCDICASTGVESGEAAIKMLLAGAKAVQVTSVLYKRGIAEVALMNEKILSWMNAKGFATIEDFRGKLSLKNSQNPAAYERVQFMKHFSGIE